MYICYERSMYVSHIRIMGMLQMQSVYSIAPTDWADLQINKEPNQMIAETISINEST